MMKPNKKSLLKFLVDVARSGYASGEAAQTKKEKDRSTTITHISGDWRMHDNFFGGEPYGGREVVFYKNKPVWIMVYYGWVNKDQNDIDEIYKFLQESLSHFPESTPLRGPKNYKKGDFVYINSWKGDIERFSGTEKIVRSGEEIYSAWYCGGLVDQRPED